MADEFKKLQDYLKVIREVYLKGLYSFYIFNALSELTAPNICGKKTAEENVEVMSRYSNFWGITKDAHKFHCIVQFSKCFDTDDSNLSLYFIKNHTGKNLDKLTKEEFAKLNGDRPFLDEIVENYRGMKLEDFKEIKGQLKKCQPSIDKLKSYRNQLCHAIPESEEVNFTVGELHEVGILIGEILNIFTKNTAHSTTWYDHVEKGAKEDVKNIIEHLKRFEPYRLKEIKEKYEKLKNK